MLGEDTHHAYNQPRINIQIIEECQDQTPNKKIRNDIKKHSTDKKYEWPIT